MLGPSATRKWCRGLLTLLLAATLCSQAFAAPPDAKESPVPAKSPAVSAVQPGTAQADVEQELTAALTAGGKLTFLVKLKGDADVKGAASAAEASAKKQGKTPAAQRLAKSNAVISSLKQVAEKGQGGLLPLLQQLQAKGSISQVQQFWIVNAIAVTGDAAALKALAARPEVEKITASKVFRIMGERTGLAVAPQSGGSAQSIEWNINQVDAPEAWALGIDGTGIVVANLDTGVEGSHPALARKWRGADGSNPAFSWFDAVNNAGSLPYDDHSHGTHTMGTLVGSDETGTNMIGVAPGARWIAAKILNAAGNGTDVDILEAGQWILAPGGDPSKAPDVVSNSWGGGAGIDEWLRPTVQAWRAAGIVPVFANGNTDPGETSCLVSVPANYPESIGVGATDINNHVAGFSCRGPSPYSEVKPELSAPGVGVRSSVPGGGYEGGWSGTSMATPHVAGVAALLRQANASLTVDEIEQIMIETAIPLTDSQYPNVPNNGYGWGLVNAFEAVSSVLTGRGTLSGRVVTSGDDLEPPVISHNAVTAGFAGFGIPLVAQVSDNVSVTEVNLYARVNGDPYYTIIPMARTSGDYKSGTYTASIPGYLVQVPTTQYYIRALDYGNNPLSTPVYDVTVTRGLQPGYSTDLETEPIGWQHGGAMDPWAWGVPTSGPNAAHSGSHLWATNLSGNYSNSTNAYLAMPPLDLTETSTAILQWWEWYDVESGYDYADVWVLDQYGGQTNVLERTGTSGGWKMRSLNLTPWAGQSIIVLFNLFSDGSVVKAGWYLDDFTLLGPDAVAPAPPANLTATADPLGTVNLTWTAGTEPDLQRYRVYRSAASGSGYSLLGEPVAASFADNTAPTGVPAYYVVTAVDIWGNESPYSNEVSVTPVGPTVYFFDNMEANDNGWTHGGTQDLWQRGAPTSGPGSAFSGANVWATNLAGNYNNNTNAWLMSPPITIGTEGTASLQFAHWYQFENNYDKGYVEISTDGGATWSQLGAFFTNASTGWVQPTYNLNAYVGQTIHLRFRMTSDSSVQKLGWYIDDVRVVGMATATSDGAWVPTKEAEKLDKTPLFSQAQPGQYKQAVPGAFGPIVIASLPADATVTVLETGRSVRTSPATGAYTITHAAGAFTARAEAYGYFPVDAAVNIPVDGSVTQNFLLEPIPTGIVSGMVTNARTGAPIPGAIVKQLEDGRVAPVMTGLDGRYSLTLLQGTYTLMVTMEGYKPFTTSVSVPGNGTAEQNAALEPFIGFPGEIAYDDGTADNAWAFYDAGNGWAVRMTPDATKGAALLKSASFFFWDTSWPVPGGTSMQLAVFDSSGDGGAPGRMLAGPIAATAIRGSWTTVDLSSLGLSFTSDFYVAYIQAVANPNAPGLATDESQPFYDRSWALVGGQWSKTPVDEGNRMIRASVMYEVAPPVIMSPADNTVTNLATVDVVGKSIDGATITIYNDGTAAGTGGVTGGTFTIPVTLHSGTNVLTATATVPAGETRPSAGVTVTLDTTPPTLTVTSPTDNQVVNREVADVVGTASDEHLAGVTVNGQAALLTNGAFSQRVLLNPGPNQITVVATDRAGNSTTVVRIVVSDVVAPAITAILPAANVTVNPGQTVAIAFDSEPGLAEAGYRIQVVTSGSTAAGSSGTPNMTETSPGHYEGTYTAPEGTSFTNATIVVWANDAAGNHTEAAAAGKLTVVAANKPPVAQWILPTNVRKNQTVTFTSTSYDPDGTITSHEWTFGDGSTASGQTVTKRYTKSGTYTVTLKVTDNQGATATITGTLVVK